MFDGMYNVHVLDLFWKETACNETVQEPKSNL